MNHLKFPRLLDTDYEKTIQGLNEEQHDVFSTEQQYFRDLHKFNLGDHSKPKSLHLYFSGPGGIEKSQAGFIHASFGKIQGF